jgi:hypothetical protein
MSPEEEFKEYVEAIKQARSEIEGADREIATACAMAAMFLSEDRVRALMVEFSFSPEEFVRLARQGKNFIASACRMVDQQAAPVN